VVSGTDTDSFILWKRQNMIEPERADAAGEGAFYFYRTNIIDIVSHVGEAEERWVGAQWEALNDEDKNFWRLLAVETVEKFFTGAPGGPCLHEEYYNTGRCAHMDCSNYIERHHGIRVGSPTDSVR
jgi:hypothetical protein